MPTATERLRDRKPQFSLIVVKPLPGERRKQSSLVVVEKPWRSKWLTACCMGAARDCKEGTCQHAKVVAEAITRCRPAAR